MVEIKLKGFISIFVARCTTGPRRAANNASDLATTSSASLDRQNVTLTIALSLAVARDL